MLRKAVKIIYTICLCFVLMIICVPLGKAKESTAAEPYIYYTGNTWTNPGDVALIRGENLDLVESLSLYRLKDNGYKSKPNYILKTRYNTLPSEDEINDASTPEWSSGDSIQMELIQQTKQSIKFVVPALLKNGIYAIKITYNSASSKAYDYYYLNAPIVQWAQGDEGSTVTPGGWLRICGSNLSEGSNDKKISVALKNTETGKITFLSPSTIYDAYSIKINIPNTMEKGTYKVYLYNGYGSKTAWSTPVEISIDDSPRSCWPTTVFNVMNYGAAGDGQVNDNAAVLGALQAAEDNGGGIVYFPAGRYLLTIGFEIPENTVIQGESKEEAMLFWTPFEWDLNELPDYIWSGKRNFAIEDITFSGARIGDFIVAGESAPSVALDNLYGITDDEPYNNIYVQNCRFYFDSFGGAPTANSDNETTMSNLVEEELQSYSSDVFTITGDNIQIINNELDCTGRSFGESGTKSNLLFQNNTISLNVWAPITKLENGIIEDCSFNDATIGVSGTNIYFARSSWSNNIGNNRESMTFDGGSGGYNGKISVMEDGVTLKLTDASGFFNSTNKGNYVGMVVYIVSGTGEAQYRKIISNTADTVTLEQPFIGELDDTTVVSLGEERNNMFFVGLNIYNSGCFQYYGSCTNAVVDGFKLARAAGIFSWGRLVYGAFQPNWYCSFINNTITDANQFKYYGYDNENKYSSLDIRGAGNQSAMNVGALVRDNTFDQGAYFTILASNGYQSVQDLIVQDNCFSNADQGIYLNFGKKAVEGILFADNTFENVVQEVVYSSEELLNETDDSGNLRILFCESSKSNVKVNFLISSIPIIIGFILTIGIIIFTVILLSKRKKIKQK